MTYDAEILNILCKHTVSRDLSITSEAGENKLNALVLPMDCPTLL